MTSRFCGFLWGSRIAVSMTCLGKEDFWFLCFPLEERPGDRRAGEGQNDLASETLQSSSVHSTQYVKAPYFRILCTEP